MDCGGNTGSSASHSRGGLAINSFQPAAAGTNDIYYRLALRCDTFHTEPHNACERETLVLGRPFRVPSAEDLSDKRFINLQNQSVEESFCIVNR